MLPKTSPGIFAWFFSGIHPANSFELLSGTIARFTIKKTSYGYSFYDFSVKSFWNTSKKLFRDFSTKFFRNYSGNSFRDSFEIALNTASRIPPRSFSGSSRGTSHWILFETPGTPSRILWGNTFGFLFLETSSSISPGILWQIPPRVSTAIPADLFGVHPEVYSGILPHTLEMEILQKFISEIL